MALWSQEKPEVTSITSMKYYFAYFIELLYLLLGDENQRTTAILSVIKG